VIKKGGTHRINIGLQIPAKDKFELCPGVKSISDPNLTLSLNRNLNRNPNLNLNLPPTNPRLGLRLRLRLRFKS
jgi:hypothetical protein